MKCMQLPSHQHWYINKAWKLSLPCTESSHWGVSPQFHCSFDNLIENDQLGSDATTIASNWKSLDGFRKGIFPNCTFTDTLLRHMSGNDRDSDRSQDINQHSTIPYAAENQLPNHGFTKQHIWQGHLKQFQKSTRDRGYQQQVTRYIDCPQVISLRELITPLSQHSLTDIMKNLLKNDMTQYINNIIKYKIKCQTWLYS